MPGGDFPMDRQNKLMWMKDLLDHLSLCCDEWQGAEGRMERYLADSIERDLDEFRRLSVSLRRDVPVGCAAG